MNKMASVSSKSTVDKLIEDNGQYADDPPVEYIVAYNNVFDGGETYGLCWTEGEKQGYFSSDFCRNPRLIFTRTKNE